MGLITETEKFGLNRMTKKAIVDSCKKNKLYVTPNLNDVLYLHFQGYQKIEELEEYTGLKCLWLESNAITEISGLDNQKLLKCLFLHNNLIQKIENLEGCKELDTLNLSHNQVMSIDNCGSDILPVLNTLNLGNNYLRTAESIETLRNCHHLSVLDLSNNRLDDMLIVKIFADMPELKVLVLTGNPVVNEIPSYRKTLIVECKKLTYLDTRPVFPRDRACAEAWKRGGFQEERRENIRWNKEERREMLRSVNATLRMRNRGGGEPEVQLIPTDSSDDDEYYSREMRPKTCEDVSPTEQWNILDEMMRNPEASENYQNCKVCGSAYCKFQHIESGDAVKEVEISTDEILESSNFTVLWGNDNLDECDSCITDCEETKENASIEMVDGGASCSYSNDSAEENASQLIEKTNSFAENVRKAPSECIGNTSMIAISGSENLSDLIKISSFPEDCDSDDDDADNDLNHNIPTDIVCKLADNLDLSVENNKTKTADSCDVDHSIVNESQNQELSELSENLTEHDTIQVVCDLLEELKFNSSNDSVNKDTSFDSSLNFGPDKDEMNKSTENICSSYHVNHDFILKHEHTNIIENTYKSTDLSTLWEETSFVEQEANEVITNCEKEDAIISDTIVEVVNYDENNVNSSMILSSTNVVNAIYSVTKCSESENPTIENVSIAIHVNKDKSVGATVPHYMLNVADAPTNAISDTTTNQDISEEDRITPNDINIVEVTSSHTAESKGSIDHCGFTLSSVHMVEDSCSDTAKTSDSVNQNFSETRCVHFSITLDCINDKETTSSNPDISDNLLIGHESINIQEAMYLNTTECNKSSKNIDTSNETSIEVCCLNVEEATCLYTAGKSGDLRNNFNSIENVLDSRNVEESNFSSKPDDLVSEDETTSGLCNINVEETNKLTIKSDGPKTILPCSLKIEEINDSNLIQYSDFTGHIDGDDVNIHHAVIETIETEYSDSMLNFACTSPSMESVTQCIEVNSEIPVECNANICKFESYNRKLNKDTSEDNEFLIARIKKNCFAMNTMLESKIERSETINIASIPDDEGEPEEYDDVDSSSKIETLGYSTFVASFEQFFNENEPKSAEFIKTVDYSSICIEEENDNSMEIAMPETKPTCDMPNVDDIPAMKNFREYRAHLKSLLHRDSELRISCNELLNEISEKLEAIEVIDKPPLTDELSQMEMPINSNDTFLNSSSSFYKICYDDPNSSLEYVSIEHNIEENNLPGVNLGPVEETEDNESNGA